MNTPIFDQLVAEFAARGKSYERMTTSYYRQPKGLRGYTPTVSQIDEVQPANTAPVAVPMDVLKMVARQQGSEDDTMSFAVVKPIAVTSLGNRGAAS